jgi:REP element-mobilizing transposase RayT
MDRFWLLTWTTYGTWLPGDARGFVGRVHDARHPSEATRVRFEHDAVGTAYDADLSGLERASRSRMKGDAIWLRIEQAQPLIEQFRQTAHHRRWELRAVAVLANHVHLVVGVPGDPDPADLLRDFKSYGSRVLSASGGKPASGTWWTQSGSRRKLPDDRAVRAAVEYVRTQRPSLAIWIAETPAASGGRQPSVDTSEQQHPNTE